MRNISYNHLGDIIFPVACEKIVSLCFSVLLYMEFYKNNAKNIDNLKIMLKAI